MPQLDKLKSREKELIEAHEKISAEIESLLDKRIKIAGAIAENQYMQKMVIGEKKEAVVNK